MEIKDQIKQRVSITDVAALYVDLKPAGKHLKALCPFHTEKTPSFFVMPEKESYTCYGCNKFGDIFTLVQEMEHLSFLEAVNFLIERFHIPVERSRRSDVSPVAEYTKLNEQALQYFREMLLDTAEGKKAQEYLKKRGLTKETAEKFKLGYALNQWEGLYSHFRQQGMDIRKGEALGLLAPSDRKSGYYDRFRGRIIIPIFSETGALIAFGGRTLFDEPAKYLNSPDTPVYKKSQHLFGFNLAKPSIREQKRVILVEGYFDLISLYQHGVTCVAASLGTALTEQQVYLLKRFSENICIWYDSDKAGIAATERGLETAFQQNLHPRVIVAPNAKDPDDFIREKGLKGFNELLENAVEGFKFLVNQAIRRFDIHVPEKKRQALDMVMGHVEKFTDPMIREEYTRMVATIFEVEGKLLVSRKAELISGRPEPAKSLVITPAEEVFLQSLVADPRLLEGVRSAMTEKIMSVLSIRNILTLLFSHYNSFSGEIEDLGGLHKGLSEPERALFSRIFDNRRFAELPKDSLEERIIGAVQEFINMYKEAEIRRINGQIKAASRDNNVSEVLRLLKEKEKYVKEKYQ